MGSVQGRRLDAGARLAFSGLSCWEASVALYLWFRFQKWSMIAICDRFFSPEGFWVLSNLGIALSRLWESLWTVSRARSVRLVFRGLSCWEASVILCLWFRLQAQSMIAICNHFRSPEVVMGFFNLGITLSSLFRFQIQSLIAICSRFCSHEGVTASKKINDQLRVPALLNCQQKEIVLKSFISGHFNYCLLIWIFSSVNSYKKLI